MHALDSGELKQVVAAGALLGAGGYFGTRALGIIEAEVVRIQQLPIPESSEELREIFARLQEQNGLGQHQNDNR